MRFLGALGIRTVRNEPVALSFAAIRNEVLAASPGIWHTAATRNLLDRMFEDAISGLFQPGPNHWQTALTGTDVRSQGSQLSRHIYQRFLLPRISRYRAALQGSTRELGELWSAVEEWSRWFCGILGAALDKKRVGYSSKTGVWNQLERLIDPGQHLTAIVTDRDWCAPIRIEAVSGPLVRKPDTGEWCVADYRLGAGTPEADITQAVLYHLLLQTAKLESEPGLTLIRFVPQGHEATYTAQELDAGIRMVKPLLARMAGVLEHQALSGGLAPAEPIGNTADDANGDGVIAPVPVADGIGQICREAGLEVERTRPAQTGGVFVRHAFELTAPAPASALAGIPATLQARLQLTSAPLIRKDRNRLVVEVPRPGAERRRVPFGALRSQLSRPASSARLPLGVDISGALRFIDLNAVTDANLVVAGVDAVSRNEWLRMALGSLVMQNTPDSLRLALLDPENNPLPGFDRASPFWWNSPEDGQSVATHLAIELGRRRAAGSVRGPRFVCVAGDLAPRTITPAVEAIAAEGRVSGMHLVVASSTFGREPLPGIIRSCFPAKVVFRMPDETASRFVLGIGGAEALLDNGDFWFQDVSEPRRLQTPATSEDEIRQIFGFAAKADMAIA